MNLANKTFRDNRTGDVVKVIDSFENIAILESKEKMDVRRLMDTNFYTEQIDPNNFFNNQGAYNSLADKIKSLSTENMKLDDPQDIASKMGGSANPTTNESAVYTSSVEDEKAELARKYGATIDNVSSTNKQNDAFAKLLGEDADELPKNQQIAEIRVQEEVVQRVEVSRDEQNSQQHQNQIDPIITMFKGVKRAVEFKMNIEISNMIPRIDFIEMMEDAYDTSIIDFLAEEFTGKLLRDPRYIKNMISERIKQVVYGGEGKKSGNPKKVVKKRIIPVVPPEDREKMAEGVEKKVKRTKKVIPPPPKPPADRKLKEGQEPEKPQSMK